VPDWFVFFTLAAISSLELGGSIAPAVTALSCPGQALQIPLGLIDPS
jgi:hypothetical protein